MRKRIWRLLALCCALGVMLAAVPSALPTAQAADAGISWELDDKSNTLTVNGAVSQDRPVYAAFFDVDGRMLSFAVLTSPGETVPVVDGAEVCRLFSLRDGLVPESMPVNVEVTGETVWVKVKETRVDTFLGGERKSVYVWDYDENWNNTVTHEKAWPNSGDDISERDVYSTYNEFGDRISCTGIIGPGGGDSLRFDYTYNADDELESYTQYEYSNVDEHIISEQRYNYAYEYNQDGYLIRKTESRYWGTDDTEAHKYLTEYTYIRGLLTVEKVFFLGSDGSNNILDSTTTYSDFDGKGNARHVEIIRPYDREEINYTYDTNGNVIIEKGSYSYTGYLDNLYTTTWESNFEYVPVKRAALPVHWAGAEDEYILWDTVG